MIKKIIKISACLFIIACAPQKRLNRLLTNHPELVKSSLDTLKIADTVYLQDIKHDTTTILKTHDTTIIMNTEKIFAKYVFDTITKEIYHEIKCLGDTVFYFKEVPIEVQKIIYQETGFKKYINWIIIFIGVFFYRFMLA